MIRLTSLRLSAAAASATARNVLPVPAGPIAEGDRVRADRVDVALLADGPRHDARRAVAPDHVVEHLRGRALAGQQPDHAGERRLVDGGLRERAELVEHAHAAFDRVLLTVERQQVAAQVGTQPESLLEREQHRVGPGGERRGEVVRQLELASHASASAAAHLLGDAPAVGAAADLRHRDRHHAAEVLDRRRARLLDRAGDDRRRAAASSSSAGR